MQQEEIKFELEDYSHLLLSGIADSAVITLDLNGFILSWNDGAQRLNGYTAEEMIGQHCSRLYAKNGQPSDKSKHALEIAKQSKRFEDLGWRVRKDGEEFFASIVTSALTDQDGIIRAFGEVSRDLTMQSLREQKLKDQLEIINLSHEAIIVRSLDGVIQFWNKGAEEMYGFTEAEALGQISHALLQTVCLNALTDAEAELREKGQWDGELINKSRKGEAVTVLSRLVVRCDANGQPLSVLEIDRGINERKKAERKGLRDKQERELRVQERIAELAASNKLLNANAIEIERSDEERELRVQERIVEIERSDSERELKVQERIVEIERSDLERELRVQERIVEIERSDSERELKVQERIVEIERSDSERELRVQERIVELAASEELLRSKTLEIQESDLERELKVQERIVEIERSDSERELKVQERIVEIERSDSERELKVQERIVEIERSDSERELKVQERIVEIERSDSERELKVQERIVEIERSDSERELKVQERIVEIERSDSERDLRVLERIVELAASEALLRSKTLEIQKSDLERELRVQERIVEIERSDSERELRVQERIVELAATEELLRSKTMELEKSDSERELRVQERIVELAASEALLRSKALEIERSDSERELRVQERIVELAASEELLRSKVLELERSNEELQQFAYVCSHDLQEPLRVISNYTQLLSKRYKGQLDDKADVFISFAVDAAKRMQDLINDLLAYSRLQTKVQNLAAVDCNQVVKMALANLEIMLSETGAAVHCDSLPTVEGDRSQLLQLFQNLISNALKFRSKEPVAINISVRQEEGAWLFTVHDNGIGLDMQFQERIFLIFQRLHTKEEYKGSGIGLAVCKKIVMRHGGRMWVESELGKGSTFFFTVPVICGG